MPHISLFFITLMETQTDAAYIAATSAITGIISRTGEFAAALIIGLSAGISGIRNKAAKNPATGIYINIRPLIEPNL